MTKILNESKQLDGKKKLIEKYQKKWKKKIIIGANYRKKL